MPNFVKIA